MKKKIDYSKIDWSGFDKSVGTVRVYFGGRVVATFGPESATREVNWDGDLWYVMSMNAKEQIAGHHVIRKMRAYAKAQLRKGRVLFRRRNGELFAEINGVGCAARYRKGWYIYGATLEEIRPLIPAIDAYEANKSRNGGRNAKK